MVPDVSTSGDELVITAGEPCEEMSSPTTLPPLNASGSLAMFGVSSYFFGAPAFLTAASILLATAPFSSAADEASSITVDIYIDVDKLLHADTGNSECPPETMLWKHHDNVFDGYEGCVSEKYLYPCAQYARPEIDWNVEKLPLNYTNGECVESGYSQENRTFWILWGDPLDVSSFLCSVLLQVSIDLLSSHTMIQFLHCTIGRYINGYDRSNPHREVSSATWTVS